MNQQQLQELGYNVTTGPWALWAILEKPKFGVLKTVWSEKIEAPDGLSHGEKLKLGWEACLVHWTSNRLEGKS